MIISLYGASSCANSDDSGNLARLLAVCMCAIPFLCIMSHLFLDGNLLTSLAVFTEHLFDIHVFTLLRSDVNIPWLLWMVNIHVFIKDICSCSCLDYMTGILLDKHSFFLKQCFCFRLSVFWKYMQYEKYSVIYMAFCFTHSIFFSFWKEGKEIIPLAHSSSL